MHSTLSQNRPLMRYHDQQLRSWQDVFCTQTRKRTAKYTYHPIDIIPKMYHNYSRLPQSGKIPPDATLRIYRLTPPTSTLQQLALFLLMLLNRAFKKE